MKKNAPLQPQTIAQDNLAHEQGSHHLKEEHKVRIAKMELLKSKGINPWPSNRTITATTQDIINEFAQKEGAEYSVAGRLMTIREHGKSIFAHIQDRTGKIQIYIKNENVGDELFELFKQCIDIGDIIWCQGISFKTKLGEISLQVKTFALVSKCLHSLPDKFHGLADIEIKHRQRYLDLIISHESKTRFLTRSKIVQAVRSVLEEYDFVEVETPMLHSIPGGAAAKPFVTHHNALDIELYLRIAPELYLKQLVVGGIERVFEINRCFRNEGISPRHNPEFTSVEYYIAYQDYHFMMNLTEEIFRRAVQKVHTTMVIPYQTYELDFGKPFARITMSQAVADALGCKVSDLDRKIDAECTKQKIELSSNQQTNGWKLFTLFEKLVEPHLIQPTFITQFPVEVSPLAKRNADNPLLTDRFELFVAHMELSNGFTELNDPFDQAERFHDQAKNRAAGDLEAHFYDANFILALEHALPPTVGAGIGIDRLVMLLTNTPSIRDIILFPTHKPKHD
jgi:lysyl-tRNA synthetase, class II